MSSNGWRKSSRSGGNGGQCVEVRIGAAVVEVRDSKAGSTGPVLRLPRAQFTAFLDDVRHGRFDPPGV